MLFYRAAPKQSLLSHNLLLLPWEAQASDLFKNGHYTTHVVETCIAQRHPQPYPREKSKRDTHTELEPTPLCSQQPPSSLLLSRQRTKLSANRRHFKLNLDALLFQKMAQTKPGHALWSSPDGWPHSSLTLCVATPLTTALLISPLAP